MILEPREFLEKLSAFKALLVSWGHMATLLPEYYNLGYDCATKKVDIWALGCIIHQILTNNHPFLSKDVRTMEDLKHIVMNGKFKIHKNLANTIYQNIISSCLRVNPKKRVDVKELI